MALPMFLAKYIVEEYPVLMNCLSGALTPLLGFVSQRSKEKLNEKTVKNDIYSLLRFCRFIIFN